MEPEDLHEGDILEGKFIMNSLHHIIDRKGAKVGKDILVAKYKTMLPAAVDRDGEYAWRQVHVIDVKQYNT